MNEDKDSKIKIFVIYFKPNTIFESNVYQPILTSDIDWTPQGMIRDDSGINIASKNKYYAELSAHYWVWKNYLSQTNAKYIGFCHYRRFLDFNLTKIPNVPFKPIKEEDFKQTFKNYTEENIVDFIGDYDIILPEKFRFENDLLSQFIEYHPPNDLVLALEVIKEIYPQYFLTAAAFIASKEMFPCLHFIMKKELLNEYFEWMFKFLETLEQRSNWNEYKGYLERMPAFIAERFFNVWLLHNIQTKKIKAKTTSSFILTGEEYGNINYQDYTKSYYAAAESELYNSVR